MLGGVDLGQVDVDGQRAAVAQDGALEAVLHSWQLFVEVELSVGHEARVVVDEGKQKHLPFLARVGRIGEVGTVHGIALPQIAKVVPFEASVGLGALFVEELSGGGIAASQMATERARGDAFLGDRVGLIEREDLDDGASGAMGLLSLERLSAIEGLL
jgi:hypothetical protein